MQSNRSLYSKRLKHTNNCHHRLTIISRRTFAADIHCFTHISVKVFFNTILSESKRQRTFLGLSQFECGANQSSVQKVILCRGQKAVWEMKRIHAPGGSTQCLLQLCVRNFLSLTVYEHTISFMMGE